MEENKMEKKKLEVGERYLSIKLLNSISVAAFRNKNKSKPEHPDYVGHGICIWINKKKEPQPQVEIEDI